MTFEQRMAELGVDLSDLPKPTKENYAYECSNSDCLERLRETINNFEGGPAGIRAYVDYILHLVNIIDRMETRIVNLTGERDYLFERISNAGELGCADCIHNGEDCSDRCFDGEGDWAGVPEDWRPNE